MNDFVSAALAIVAGVLGLSIVSVLVSKNAQTPTVINAAGSALSNVISAAVNPVTGTGTGGSSGVNSSFSAGMLGSGLSFLNGAGSNLGGLFGQ